MADIANKYAESVSGKFCVDEQCIDCDLSGKPHPLISRRASKQIPIS